jgi:hypothetical protein
VPIGERHLRAVVREYVEPYRCERSRRGSPLDPRGDRRWARRARSDRTTDRSSPSHSCALGPWGR